MLECALISPGASDFQLHVKLSELIESQLEAVAVTAGDRSVETQLLLLHLTQLRSQGGWFEKAAGRMD